jgi:hypothetical protein
MLEGESASMEYHRRSNSNTNKNRENKLPERHPTPSPPPNIFKLWKTFADYL